jgi:hypothetical protein
LRKPAIEKIRGNFTVKCRFELNIGINRGSFSLYPKQNYLFSGFLRQIRGVSPSIYALFQYCLLIKGNSSLYSSAGVSQAPRNAREPLVPGAEINSYHL